jgi:FkbM family methyltransferase
VNFIQRINKPEYLYRPGQLLRRMTQAVQPEPDTVEVGLPWGLRMRVRPQEDHGRALWRLGVYDLVVSEALWRLLNRGETAIDAGANIGYMTGLMAARLGTGGSVLAFEPHPKVFFAELASNLAAWAKQPIARTTPLQVALSSKSGTGRLQEPFDFDRNGGTSKLILGEASGTRVKTVCLDEVCLKYGCADVLKLDVEGHELEVLRGARNLLQAGALRDVIFEEQSGTVMSPVACLLSGFGYTIFRLTRTLRGPLLAHWQDRSSTVPYLPPSLLATREPLRAVARFRAGGWLVLH